MATEAAKLYWPIRRFYYQALLAARTVFINVYFPIQTPQPKSANFDTFKRTPRPSIIQLNYQDQKNIRSLRTASSPIFLLSPSFPIFCLPPFIFPAIEPSCLLSPFPFQLFIAAFLLISTVPPPHSTCSPIITLGLPTIRRGTVKIERGVE